MLATQYNLWESTQGSGLLKPEAKRSGGVGIPLSEELAREVI